jgi:hypothetical protein
MARLPRRPALGVALALSVAFPLAAQAPGGKTPPAQGPKGGPPAATQPAPRAQAPAPGTPSNLPAIVQLRALLGADVILRFGNAAEEGGVTRLSAVELQRGDELVRAAELTLQGLRPDGLERLEARDVRGNEAAGNIEVGRIEVVNFARRATRPGQELQPDDIRMERAVAERIRFKDDDEVSLERLEMSGWGPGLTFAGSATGLRVIPEARDTADRVEVARIAVGGFDAATLIAAIVQDRMPTELPPGRSSFEVEGVEVHKATDRLGGLERLRLTGDSGPNRPHDIGFELRGLTINAANGPTGMLRGYGYDALRADLTIEGRHDPARERVEVRTFAFGVQQAGAIGLALDLQNVRPNAPPAFNGGRLRYADDGLIRRLLQSQAQQQATTEQALRDQAVATATLLLADQRGTSLAAVRDPVIRFLRGEAREIEAVSRPPQPVNQDAVAKAPSDAAGWVRLLGLTVTAR